MDNIYIQELEPVQVVAQVPDDNTKVGVTASTKWIGMILGGLALLSLGGLLKRKARRYVRKSFKRKNRY